MNITIRRIGSLLVAAMGLMAGGARAHATSIVVHAAECQSNGNSGDIVAETNGLRNKSTTSSHTVTCSVPRVVPAPDGAATWNFIVDGTNPSGKSTSCTVTAFNFAGTQVAAQSFSTSQA